MLWKIALELKMPRIIVVEDDPAIGEMLTYHLKDLNFDVQLFNDGLEAKNHLTSNDDFDLVILDIMLPGYNGLDLCRELRQLKPDLLIMMLTSLDGEADRVIGLELGADDYLTKPFSVRECQARVKALLRRAQRSSLAPSHVLIPFPLPRLSISNPSKPSSFADSLFVPSLVAIT